MRQCDTCRLCCWSFPVPDVPDEVAGQLMKSSLAHCQHECAKGCDLHGKPEQPDICRTFQCPYIRDEDVHRPDTFQSLLEHLGGNMSSYIPAVASVIPVSAALDLIETSRTIPAYMLLEGRWLHTVLPLDRQADGQWTTTGVDEWANLYKQYGATLQSEDAELVMI